MILDNPKNNLIFLYKELWPDEVFPVRNMVFLCHTIIEDNTFINVTEYILRSVIYHESKLYK